MAMVSGGNLRELAVAVAGIDGKFRESAVALPGIYGNGGGVGGKFRESAVALSGIGGGLAAGDGLGFITW